MTAIGKTSATADSFKVLVVEDEAAVRRVFELGLAADGFAVMTAGSGREAFTLLMQESFNVLVVDLRMQEMDGIVFLQEALKVWPWLGVVICSAFVDEYDIPTVKALGVRHILAKPVSIETLCDNVRQVARARHEEPSGIPMSTALTLMRDHLRLLARISNRTIAAETLQQALFEFVNELGPTLPSHVIGMLVCGQNEAAWDLLFECQSAVSQPFLTRLEEEMLARYQALSGQAIERTALRTRTRGVECDPSAPAAIRGSLSVPVLSEDRVCGLLTVATATEQAYSSADVALLYYAANHISVVFAALQRIEHLATRDPLTDVFNRVLLEHELDRAWQTARRCASSMAVVIVDIDDFKTINDSYGHATGDEVLRDFARLLQSVTRATDILARYGGDEFVAVLPCADEADARAFADRFLEVLRPHVFCRSAQRLTLKASVGIATSRNPTPPTTSDELLRQADRALYMAKRAGRDRVCIWPKQEIGGATAAAAAGPAAAGPAGPSEPAAAAAAAARIHDHILVVDDEVSILDLVRRMLERGGYTVTAFTTADEAVAAIRQRPGAYDILLTDLALPGKTGIDLLREVSAADDSIVKVVMTGFASVDTAVNCLREGAYDFIEKPLRHAQLAGLIKRAREYRYLKLENARYQAHLEEMVRQRSAQLAASLEEVKKSYEFTLEALAAMLDAREQQTGRHGVRSQRLALFLARQAGVGEDVLDAIGTGALLHDIGKIGVPDEILLKRGPLSPHEWEIMKQHAEVGYRILKSSPYHKGAAEILLSHHEHYDGSGYPRGLRGQQICLGARIFSVIDAYDCMRSGRFYRGTLSPVEATAEIERNSGRQFDPDVVEVFLRHQPEIERLLAAEL